ncbi:putative Asp domain protein [Rhizoctonia solani 123E]|uniref:Putative Asp domain protein n=1 Tax=Rhizoctonia solani 123E TaxID=1423351 RepID=A0A074T0T2_9AGAM|nr:putative Asp domain protein [Rhizoctonia solani 123E]
MSSDHEQLPPYSHNSDRLPQYSRLSEAPTSSKLPPNHYVIRSRRMALDLGQRYQSTRVPAFGREGLVEGHVWVQSFENVEKILVTLTGSLVSYFLEFGTANRPQVRKLINQTHELWTEQGHNSAAGKEGRSLAFALVMPEHVEGMESNDGRPIPLPPSASITMCDAGAHVAYMVRVDMFRKSWRTHDTQVTPSVKSEILYLPRTTTRYSRPFLPLPNSEKLRPTQAEEWSVLNIPQKAKTKPGIPLSKPGSSSKAPSQPHMSLPQSLREDLIIRLYLPHGLRYPAGRDILWSITIVFPRTGSSASSVRSGRSSSSMNDEQTNALIAGVSLRLICISTVAVRGVASRRERVVAVGQPLMSVPNGVTSDGERQIIIRGYLRSGEEEKDMSWGVPGCISVVVSSG